MKNRMIRELQVFEVLRNPIKKGLPTQPHRFRWRGARSKQRWIDVVFEKWADQLCIVTVVDILDE